MPRYFYTHQAREDIRGIAKYIAQFNHSAAKSTQQKIRRVCREITATSPNIGTMCPEIGPAVRYFTIGNYIVFFRGKSPVEILRVIHGSVDWQNESII